MPRTTSGLIVPFGDTAGRGWFDVTFEPGALTITDVARVPLLFEHGATHAVVGIMSDVEETADGVVATFTLDDTPDGERAAAELEAGSRTGLSIGIEYDDDTLQAIVDAFWEPEGDERPTISAAGIVREVSHVAVPAFDSARLTTISDTDADDSADATTERNQ